MTKIEEYQNKKVQLENELTEINRNIILTEQSISQSEELFKTQFDTTDPIKLQEIADNYTKIIQEKEAELASLDQVV